MHTQNLSTAELLLIVQAINIRPSGLTVEANLENVSTFDLDYVIACLDLLAVSPHERSFKRQLLDKLSHDHAPDRISRRPGSCAHTRTRRLPNGRLLCFDCHHELD
jgi:hypothetical protein